MQSPTNQLPLVHRTFVNSWECDENRHWNVQFYYRAFQQASELLALEVSGQNPGARTAIVRHVRYHRELAEGRPVGVWSGVVGDGEMAGSVVHLLLDLEAGSLAATALDQPGYRAQGATVISAESVAQAIPRGVKPGPQPPVDTAPLLQGGQALMANSSVVRSFETGPDGDLLSNAIVSRFTDGAPHLWTHAGIDTRWLQEANHGRVAVEMKMTRLNPAREGQALRLVSWVDAMNEKTMSISHQLEEVGTCLAIATGQVIALVMNLETRKSVPMPRSVIEAFEKQMGDSANRVQ
ncbi:MAG: thioesterase family protein [Rhizobiaceae bacterium]